MKVSESKTLLQHFQLSDVRAVAQLAAQTTAGVSRIVEGMHQSVLGTMGMPGGQVPGQTAGLTGLIYRTVHDSALIMGRGAATVLGALESFLDSSVDNKHVSPEREAVIAALNGLMGDRLLASQNPLATAMTMRYRGEVVNGLALLPSHAVTGKLLLMVHGLFMNDLQWRVESEERVVDHGAELASALKYTPIYLRYNSGLHIAQNGHELSIQLEDLTNHWPLALEEVTIMGYSMGGLVVRSALHQAQEAGLNWPRRLKKIVFLATPHHGAPLERAGNWADIILGSTPYTAPLTKIGQLRSAGITDLRYGNLLDENWLDGDRFQHKSGQLRHVPLPGNVDCFTIAATTAAKRGLLADRLLGDGLVPLNSALGKHKNEQRALGFSKDAHWIAYRTNHLALLGRAEVTEKLVDWLSS